MTDFTLPAMASICVILFWIFRALMFFDMPKCRFISNSNFKKPKLRFGKARFIGGRRYSRRSRRRSNMKHLHRHHFSKAVLTFIYYMTFLWHFRLAWHISAKSQNKKMHYLHGNGPSKASEGKGQKGKHRSAPKGGQPPIASTSANLTTEADDLDLIEQIQAALPQAAVIRSQSTLDSAEWNAPTVSPQLLDHRGGIALTPPRMIPETLWKVGFTTMPTAILTSQPAQDLGMKGFPQQQVRCAILVVNKEGNRDRVEVNRWLIQISYGQPVSQILQGRKVDIFTLMRFHIAKFPSRLAGLKKYLPTSWQRNSRNMCLKMPSPK